jgi:hypothetical protein
MSHLGDSGSHGTVAKRIKMNRNWNAKGTRHEALPAMNLIIISKGYQVV